MVKAFLTKSAAAQGRTHHELSSDGCLWSATLLGGIGAVAIGVSGMLAALLRAVGGDRLVAAALGAAVGFGGRTLRDLRDLPPGGRTTWHPSATT